MKVRTRRKIRARVLRVKWRTAWVWWQVKWQWQLLTIPGSRAAIRRILAPYEIEA